MTTKIAIVGRANSGKTTLVRTMTKGVHGEVDDRAGVTDNIDPVYYPSLHAELIDTPGFQQAGIVMHLIEGDIGRVDKLDESEFRHEKLALKALNGADACIYLATVESAPDASHDKEIKLVRMANPRTVGMLNKTRLLEKTLAASAARRRVTDWETRLRAGGIGDVFDFDAHWDRYSRLNEVYQALARQMADQKRADFEKGLQQFSETLATARQMVAKRAAECIAACRALRETKDTVVDHYNRSASLEELKAKILKQLEEFETEFADEVVRIYGIGVKGSGNGGPSYNESVFRRFGDRASEMAKYSAIGAVLGGALGAAIGFIFAGPVGAVGGAKLGAGAVGTVGAGAGAVTEVNETVTVGLSENDLKHTALMCLATVWCATHHGFGLDPSATADGYSRSMAIVSKEVKKMSHPHWSSCTEKQMADWFSTTLAQLDM